MDARRALKPQQVWAIRFWLDEHRRLRDRALFDFAIDSKLRSCDVMKVRIGDIVAGARPQFIGIEHLTDTEICTIREALEREEHKGISSVASADASVDELLARR